MRMSGLAGFVGAALAAGLATSSLPMPGKAEDAGPGAVADPLQELAPAPAFVRPDLGVVVARPQASDIRPSLIGPVLLMKSAQVDLEKGTVRLPLRRARLTSGESVWFVLTDAADQGLADLHGLVHAPKLAYAFTGRNRRTAEIEKDGSWVFSRGKVDFSPDWVVSPGKAPNYFPPQRSQTGSVGDENYTPIVEVENAGGNALFNAPMLAFNVTEQQLNAFCDGHVDHRLVHDRVVAICPRAGWVTLQLSLGFAFGRPVLYFSTEADDPIVAALEKSTYAPAMQDIPFALHESEPGEAGSRIYVLVNGATGADNPQRQGLNSALADGRSPLNVLGGLPTLTLDYSPLWRIFPAIWTEAAIRQGYRQRLTDVVVIEDMVRRGFVKGLEGGTFRPAGFTVNCPVVYRLE